MINKLFHISKKLYANNFLNVNSDLKEIIEKTGKSISTGTEVTDYIVLYKYIKKFKPKIILECGTGRSTFIIAHAMKKYCGKGSKLISMESVKKYYRAQNNIFPIKEFPFVKIIYSPLKFYKYSFISGTGYAKIPPLDYNFVFIDGPVGRYRENYNFEPGKINIDLLNIILKNKKIKIDGLIDNRKLTVLGYSILFGNKIVNFNKSLNLGFINEACFDNLKLKKNIFKETIFHDFVNTRFF